MLLLGPVPVVRGVPQVPEEVGAAILKLFMLLGSIYVNGVATHMSASE